MHTLADVGTAPDASALAEAIARRCEDAHPYQDEWRARCPNHQGKSDTSLSLTPADDRVLIHCHGACAPEDVVHALGLTMADLFLKPSTNGHKRIVKIYDYFDEHGTLVHQTVRYDPKDFRQRRPDPAHPGQYIWSLKGITPVLYRLPEILAAVQHGETVYVVEGEKAADALAALGLAATCNPMGAGKWRKTYSEVLRGAPVVILPDHDEPGLRHAERVAKALEGIAANIKVVPVPGQLSDHGDVSDWLAAGGTRADLEAAVENMPWYTVPPVGDVLHRQRLRNRRPSAPLAALAPQRRHCATGFPSMSAGYGSRRRSTRRNANRWMSGCVRRSISWRRPGMSITTITGICWSSTTATTTPNNGRCLSNCWKSAENTARCCDASGFQ